MKRALAWLAALAVILVAAIYWRGTSRRPFRQALEVRALATWGLGRYLTQLDPAARWLVISNPFVQRSDIDPEVRRNEEAGLRGLREALGEGADKMVVVYPKLRPEAEADPRSVPVDLATTTPLSYMVTDDAFDTLVEAHPECSIVVSLIGLPLHLNAVQAWTRVGPPRFALLLPDLRMIGDARAILRAMQSGKLAAFVLPKPGAPDTEAPLEEDRQAAFERRYLLVTAENIEELMRTYPALFGIQPKSF